MEMMGTLNRYAAGIKRASIGVTALALFLLAWFVPLAPIAPTVQALIAWIDGLGAGADVMVVLYQECGLCEFVVTDERIQ
jgi:hypothetical protein